MSPPITAVNHKYPTRFCLRTAPALLPHSSNKVLKNDHLLVSYKRRGRTNKRPSYYYYFPEELIFNILIYVPAKMLDQVMKYVCWGWYHMVKEPAFVTAHLQSSTIAVLAQNPRDEKSVAFSFELNNNNSVIELTEYRMPFTKARICASCNGLVLLFDPVHREHFHVVNLVTGANKSLPPLGPQVYKYCTIQATLACATDGHYKVICSLGAVGTGYRLLVCTIGKDHGWRIIELSPSKQSKMMLLRSAIYIAGFVYWVQASSYYFYALDVDSEVMYESFTAKNQGYSALSYVVMDKTMGFIARRGFDHPNVWLFYELADLESGK